MKEFAPEERKFIEFKDKHRTTRNSCYKGK